MLFLGRERGGGSEREKNEAVVREDVIIAIPVYTVYNRFTPNYFLREFFFNHFEVGNDTNTHTYTYIYIYTPVYILLV